MNKLNYYRHSGHCYPELVEKQNGRVIAQMKSVLWKEDYVRCDQKFQEILREPLKEGIKILFLAKILFDPAHGLSLWIMDIDPSYTLGDLEREKQETLDRLREEGIFERNRALTLAVLPQRIAIISVETSKGLADFKKVIETNSWGYRFFSFLFPSLLQGDKAVAAICYQLNRIRKVKHHFDVVAIVRGGGGDVGLSCYNNYQLARAIALFPIPVITGIGHATNETVAEMVSFYNAITPTKLADFLLQRFHNFSVPVQEAERKIRERSRRFIAEEGVRFQSEVKLFRSVTENVLAVNEGEMKNLSRSLHQHSAYLFKSQRELLAIARNSAARGVAALCGNERRELRHHAAVIRKDAVSYVSRVRSGILQVKDKLLSHAGRIVRDKFVVLTAIEKNVDNMNPENVLKRGYSITLLNGRSVASISQVSPGDTLETLLHDGTITSTTQSLQEKKHE
jgi:exodeoxyribonuclease VII large subunit